MTYFRDRGGQLIQFDDSYRFENEPLNDDQLDILLQIREKKRGRKLVYVIQSVKGDTFYDEDLGKIFVRESATWRGADLAEEAEFIRLAVAEASDKKRPKLKKAAG